METTKINMGEQPKGKKETEKLNRDDHGVSYSTSAEKTGEATPEEAKKKNIGNAARSAAAGAVGGMVGGGVAMAANAASEGGAADAVDDSLNLHPSPNTQAASRTEQEESPDDAVIEEDLAEEKPIENLQGGDTPEMQEAPAPQQEAPHIEEILVDPDDIDGDKIMNIEGTGIVEIDGAEVNAAIVTDGEGNTYFMVDVDGEINDPNATYDIIVDAENGEMASIPMELSVSDAQLMADNNIAYTGPVDGDSNNIAQEDMLVDIYDPSQPVDDEPSFTELADGQDSDPMMDLIDPLA